MNLNLEQKQKQVKWFVINLTISFGSKKAEQKTGVGKLKDKFSFCLQFLFKNLLFF